MVTAPLQVHPSNADQARAWDGAEGAFWAAHADAFEASVSGYDERFAATAAITTGERVLDVGCGTGRTTLDAARAAGPSGDALGVDLSTAMLDVARSRAVAEGVGNVRFVRADAQVHPFPAAGRDVVLSRTGAMFFGDPVAAFGNLATAVRPGGRMVLLVWQPPDRNEWLTAVLGALAAGRTLPQPPPDRPGPFSLSSPARVRAVLGASGWTDVGCAPVSAPFRYGRTVDDAVEFVSGLMAWLLAGLDEDRRTGALAALRALMRSHAQDEGVLFRSAAWLVTARRPG